MIIHSAVARHVCVLLGYLYPALASAKTAVQQDPAAFTQWMTYWVVMSVFAMVELLFDFFVSWVPFYYEAKIVLIVWLTLPRYQGASQIYRRVINPYLEQYEGEIDNGLEGMRVEARRRIQSLGATAASEIARAVTRQGTSAKDQLIARVLGMAVTGGDQELDRAAVRSAPPSPMPRRLYEIDTASVSSPRGQGLEDVTAAMAAAAEEDTDSSSSMLPDFLEIMRGGVCVMVRTSFDGDRGDESWRPRRIRVLRGRQFCLTDDCDDENRVGKEDGNLRGGGGGGARVGERFEVLTARADVLSDESLVLQTDRGQVRLSLPGCDDRDSLLMGFELLLQSPATATNDDENAKSDCAMKDNEIRKRQSEEGRWAEDIMSVDSSDDGDEQEGAEDEDHPSTSMSPLRKSWVEL